MGINSRIEGGVAVIELDGRFTSGEILDEFRARWSQALVSGARAVVVSLAGVRMIDSSGIGALVRCSAGLSAMGGRMRVAAANDAVLMALKFTRLDKLLEMYPDEPSAMAAAAGR